jgi:hypothetical protein
MAEDRSISASGKNAGQESAQHHLVDAPLVGVEPGQRRRRHRPAGRDDGVVIARHDDRRRPSAAVRSPPRAPAGTKPPSDGWPATASKIDGSSERASCGRWRESVRG